MADLTTYEKRLLSECIILELGRCEKFFTIDKRRVKHLESISKKLSLLNMRGIDRSTTVKEEINNLLQ